MSLSIKNGRVSTEIGALAVCVTSTVTFLIAASVLKPNFGIIEWWVFVNAVMAWLSGATWRCLSLHTEKLLSDERKELLLEGEKPREELRRREEVCCRQIELLLQRSLALAPKMPVDAQNDGGVCGDQGNNENDLQS